MKTAKELFEELGYDFGIVKYDDFKPDYNYVDEDGNCICFDLQDKRIEFIFHNQLTINMDELQAINQQIKELSWND